MWHMNENIYFALVFFPGATVSALVFPFPGELGSISGCLSVTTQNSEDIIWGYLFSGIECLNVLITVSSNLFQVTSISIFCTLND